MSEPKRSIDELRDLIQPLHGYIDCKIQHISSTSWYRVTGVHFKEDDMTIWFTYTTLHTKRPIQFARPIAELLDGRFAH